MAHARQNQILPVFEDAAGQSASSAGLYRSSTVGLDGRRAAGAAPEMPTPLDTGVGAKPFITGRPTAEQRRI